MNAIFPGSFDPFTLGHLSIVNRAIPLFDKIFISLGTNQDKKSLFTLEQRIEWVKQIFDNEPKVEVTIYDLLTVDYAHKIGASYIIRGLRNSVDFEYERQIGLINKSLMPEIETLFLLTMPEHTHISSSMVREIVKYKGDISKLVPENIANDIKMSY